MSLILEGIEGLTPLIASNFSCTRQLELRSQAVFFLLNTNDRLRRRTPLAWSIFRQNPTK